MISKIGEGIVLKSFSSLLPDVTRFEISSGDFPANRLLLWYNSQRVHPKEYISVLLFSINICGVFEDSTSGADQAGLPIIESFPEIPKSERTSSKLLSTKKLSKH